VLIDPELANGSFIGRQSRADNHKKLHTSDSKVAARNMDFHSIGKITLRSRDFARTERFYHDLFGWKFQQYSATYMGFEPPSGIGGGFQKRDSFSQGDSYLIYILVDEFETYLERIPQLGGRCGEEIEVVSEDVQYVRVYDPDGNRLALLRDKSPGDGVNN
jgi:predicted enzyme related to lactoylglutathione lyase